MNAFRSGLWCVLAALASAWPGFLPAQEVRGLYEGQVSVSSEQEGERAAAQGRALRQVLGKLSGNVDAGGAVVDEAVAQPQRYLQQFAYRKTQDPATPLTLWASFEPAAVDALLRAARLPVWSAQRPGVLVWIVLATGDGLDLLSAESGAAQAPVVAALVAALNVRAWERGLELRFPLLDLEDRARIQATDIWQLDGDKIAAASARYGSGAVLIGRMEPGASGAWNARWTMIETGETQQWTTQGLSAAASVPRAVDALADRLAARYAIVGAGTGVAAAGTDDGIDVRISNVGTLNDYVRVLEYLRGLDQVSALVLRATLPGELRLHMQVRGGGEGLRRVVAFGDVLGVEATPAADGALSFRLRP